MRRLLLVLIASLIVAADATAAEPTCPVTSAEARAERLLRQEIRGREQHGFRADRAYVARLIAARPPSRRYGIRVTAAEDRYLDRFYRIGVGAKLGRYLRKQTDVMDFWEVLDDWPRGPYVAVFLKGDPARHRAAVKRLASYPRSTRIVRVRYSDRDKERIEDRIQRDDKALTRAGFEIVETDSTWGLDRVLVEIVTRRKDAQRYFTRRYGPAVKTRVRTQRTFDGCARSTAYTIAPDGMSLTVSYEDAPKPRRIEVTETGDRVSVGLVVGRSIYPSGGEPGGKAIVRLSAPIGNRPVYDASDGRRLRPVRAGPRPAAVPATARGVRARRAHPRACAIRHERRSRLRADADRRAAALHAGGAGMARQRPARRVRPGRSRLPLRRPRLSRLGRHDPGGALPGAAVADHPLRTPVRVSHARAGHGGKGPDPLRTVDGPA